MMRVSAKAWPWLAALLLAACGGSGGSSGSGGNNDNADALAEDNEPVTTASAPLARTRFVIIGDSGSGSTGQYAVGQAIADVCAAKAGPGAQRAGCDLVVGLGDNIYEAGVTSVDDPQFKEKFELPFEPVQLPFYMVLGNHDNTGYVGGDGAGNARGEFQVDYSFFDGRLSDRWHMPDRYYRHGVGENRDGRVLVDFFALDSNPIAGGFADADLAYAYHTYGIDQRNWAVDAIAGSDAVFKIAMAHHPYLSNGSHGNAGNYDDVPGELLPVLAGERWKAFLEEAVCDQTDFFLAGHDHDLQVLEAVPGCGRTEFVVSGAAGKTRSLGDPQRNAARFQQGDTYGFFWAEAIDGGPAGEPPRLCLEAYSVAPGETGLGVTDGDTLTPAYQHCFEKVPPAGMAPSNDFSGQTISAEALPLPLPDGFDAGFAGPLAELRQTLVSGFTEVGAELPAEQRQVFDQLLAGSDMLIGALDATVSAILSDDDTDMAQAFQAVLAASEQLEALDTAALPAPFDQLQGAFDAFADGLGNGETEPGEGSTAEDVAFLAGPLVTLARNLDNIVDGIDEQMPEGTPVLAGLTSVLSTVSLGLANTLEQLVLLDSSATGEQLAGTLQASLEQLAVDVLWLNRIPGAEGEATMPGDLLASALLSVVREVTEQIDNRLLSPLDPLLNLLSPITELIVGWLEAL